MRFRIHHAVIAMTAGFALVLGVVPVSAQSLKRVVVGTGFNRPVFATAAPGDTDRLFVVEKAGVIKILDLRTGDTLPTPFLDIDFRVSGGTSTSAETGLLGLAFHPNYAANGRFYVNYTGNSGGLTTIVAEYTVTANPNVADVDSERSIIRYAQPASNHNGGWIGFGPMDGLLYVAAGDGGNQCDPDLNGQNTSTMLASILRLDVNGDDFPAEVNRNYAIPAGNPFIAVAGNDEIWSYGLRNPYRCSFDRMTGDFYIGDVGQGNWEEVNYQPHGSGAGWNYGWNCREGNHNVNCPVLGCDPTDPSLRPAIDEYAHNQGCAITGGYVYRGCALLGEMGTYFYADYCSARVWSFEVVGGLLTNNLDRTSELTTPGGMVSFGEDATGELYIVTQGFAINSGVIFRVVEDGVPGDIDGDTDVDAADLSLFVAVLLGNDADCTRVMRCDLSSDGHADGDDIAAFVDAMIS